MIPVVNTNTVTATTNKDSNTNTNTITITNTNTLTGVKKPPSAAVPNVPPLPSGTNTGTSTSNVSSDTNTNTITITNTTTIKDCPTSGTSRPQTVGDNDDGEDKERGEGSMTALKEE
ncbi:hypothetical protein BT96DRAFT_928381 [Gymnopus androsaceus JB14]|uniref:Uncharacterized protein n=1 Tax=Gymnopus androsaceus JB14 TaxID=1447944 RepID=A0A6A4GKI2_9AGAR|nr:hypothetical protein BT96DRAFT_928381 [Gymnopus androsaceus JB14]